MPKTAKELSAIEVKRLDTPGMHAVGGVAGLRLSVSSTGARSWILRTVVGDKRREIGLGGYPTVTLADARTKARENRALIESGEDPVAKKVAAKQNLKHQQRHTITFKEAARQLLQSKAPEWKNAKHAQQWASTLDRYAYPELGHMPPSDIKLHDVLRVLNPIWAVKNETASRLRGRIESVLDWAKVHGYSEGENAARWKGHLDKVLPRPSKVQKVKHHAAVPYSDASKLMAKLSESSGTAAAALRLLLLTAARSGEVRGMRWSEVDFKTKLWTIPAERMKADKEHIVPLSDGALSLLERMRGAGDVTTDGLVFASTTTGKPLSDMAFKQVLKRAGFGAYTAHGLRSTFRDWAGEKTHYPREVIEHALAHQLKDKAEAAYARGTLLDKRKSLMNDWSDYCESAIRR